jgi:adenylosuccinate lyase
MIFIEKELQNLGGILLKAAEDTRDLLCLGRSHGISAEAMIFGQKFLSFHAELSRRIHEWKEARLALTGQMSGAVGNYTIVTPEQEEKTIKTLGLKVERVSTQVIPRDHYAKIISLGALIGSLFERMATELRLLQHSDIDEVREGFSNGQKGSSTMPHKKNPISSENISGMARVLRSHLPPMLENCALWHERDISHSSVERMIFPDHFGILAYSTKRMKTVIENLVIDRERIEMKVKSSEKIYSSFVLHQLIETNPEKSREIIYEVVQKSFFNSKNVAELVLNLQSDLSEHHLNHRANEWVNFENLREHYKKQFLKVLKRQ